MGRFFDLGDRDLSDNWVFGSVIAAIPAYVLPWIIWNAPFWGAITGCITVSSILIAGLFPELHRSWKLWAMLTIVTIVSISLSVAVMPRTLQGPSQAILGGFMLANGIITLFLVKRFFRID